MDGLEGDYLQGGLVWMYMFKEGRWADLTDYTGYTCQRVATVCITEERLLTVQDPILEPAWRERLNLHCYYTDSMHDKRRSRSVWVSAESDRMSALRVSALLERPIYPYFHHWCKSITKTSTISAKQPKVLAVRRLIPDYLFTNY